MLRGLSLVVLFAAGCVEHVQLAGDATGSGSGALADLVSIDVEPSTTSLPVELSAPPTDLPYTATGRFTDGSQRDITGLVTWGTDNAAPGAFGSDSGIYETSNTAGGHVEVSAISGTVVGSASLIVVASTTVVDAEYPPPADPADLFSSDNPVVSDAMRSPALLYPSDNTMFPQGLAQVLVQYSRGMSNDVTEIAFDSDVLHVTIYTAAVDRWLPDGALWSTIERSNVASTVTLQVRAAESTGSGTIYGGAAATIKFSRSAADGLVDYWSGGTNGIMQAPLSSPTAGKLYPATTDNTCAGCHAISRDGAHIAFGYGGETLQTIDTRTLATEIPATSKIPMGWATFSPAGDRVLVANHGVLTLYDAVTGTPIGPGKGVVPLTGMATHPDWSPDGTQIVVALASMVPNNMDMKGGQIAVVPYNGGAWGTPQVLVSSTGDNDNNFFPRWSPDGGLIAYVHASSSSHAAATAELRLIPAAGGTPTVLGNASHAVGFATGVANLSDTMPTWAPRQDDVSWLAFASVRPYGDVRPGAGGPAQVWITAVDLSRTGDPSFAAFWLPSQDSTTLNNNPVWTVGPDASTERR
jgi:hypothetical protein